MTEMQRDVNDIKKILDSLTNGFLFMGISNHDKNLFMTSFSDSITSVIEAVSFGAQEDDLYVYMCCAFAVKKEPSLLNKIREFERVHGHKKLYELLHKSADYSNIEESALSLSFLIKNNLTNE